MKLATKKVVNDLKQFISQKDNALFQFFGIYADLEVDEFIKEKIEDWEFVMTLTEINKEHKRFGGNFKIFLMSIIYKMQIIVLQDESKGLILGTNTEIFSLFWIRRSSSKIAPILPLVPHSLLLSN